MSGYVRYFEDGSKNMSFKIEDESVYVKYNQIWNKFKNCWVLNFILNQFMMSHIKTKVKTFSDIVKALFSGDEIPIKRV